MFMVRAIQEFGISLEANGFNACFNVFLPIQQFGLLQSFKSKH